MASKFNFERAFVGLIERTKDPMAPIKLQEAYSRADQIGKMMAGTTTKIEVAAYLDLLLSSWPDNKVKEVCGSPAFVMAVAGLFAQSLVEYAKETHNGVRDVTD